mmetsp:Transcript_21894/g.44737  ORF Transcript_21894/g.44737 Transcript_21894/m.44737 type:complete len:235 (+) Transcript_21894:609-1313(+)
MMTPLYAAPAWRRAHSLFWSATSTPMKMAPMITRMSPKKWEEALSTSSNTRLPLSTSLSPLVRPCARMSDWHIGKVSMLLLRSSSVSLWAVPPSCSISSSSAAPESFTKQSFMSSCEIALLSRTERTSAAVPSAPTCCRAMLTVCTWQPGSRSTRASMRQPAGPIAQRSRLTRVQCSKIDRAAHSSRIMKSQNANMSRSAKPSFSSGRNSARRSRRNARTPECGVSCSDLHSAQ